MNRNKEKKRLNIWKILFLMFLMAGTIYVIRNNHDKQVKQIEEKKKEYTEKNWQKVDEKGNKYSSRSITDEYINNSGSVFGTFYSITYRSDKDLHDGLRERMAQVDSSLSPFNKKSVISAINENRDFGTDAMFTEVFTIARNVSEKTDGAFDITVAPLVNAWGFGFKNGITVEESTIDSIMKFVGFKKVYIENGKVRKEHPETMLDCSAIAKGYGCDAVAKFLDQNGIEDYLVEIGGEVVARGKSTKGKEWTIGISKPVDDPSGKNHGMQTAVNASGKGIATSGNYRNYREENGKKISHTIDPLTGYPVQHSLLSATVIAEDCATADAYATAFMVMGVEKAMETCGKENSIDGFFIYAGENGNYATCMSEGFKKHIAE